MNNSGPTAQIIERDGWKAELDFVGHRKAITCVVSIDWGCEDVYANRVCALFRRSVQGGVPWFL